ncbi:MAG: hypothetical protein HY002_08450 [Candidatus Rokubacteria bacterium]|nr:hypothetical protein [Candidatus Rokubacteria bacterium]
MLSTFDSYLRQQLGFAGGLEQVFQNRAAREWVRRGGAAEDEFLGNEILGAALRSINHFHNPRLTWDRAGLDAVSLCPPFILRGEASVRWAQDPDQGISGRAAWGDARQSFYEALTGPLKTGDTGRDAAFARTFQILGQQMHLLADLAVPAHTRNDAHCPFPDGFEHWAARNPALVAGVIAGPPVQPDKAIFAVGVPIPNEEIARVPVARLWDSDQYDANPDITRSPTIGLAEYTNANFFSDHTIFSENLPFPARTSVALRLQPEEAPGTGGELRRYFEKVADGEAPIDHLAVPGALYSYLPDALKDQNIGLDAKVFADYAAKLLPRAVAYSAGLLDYFFRGRLEGQVEVGTDGITRLRVVNRTPDEWMPTGTLALYYDAADGSRRPLLAPTLLPAPLAPDIPVVLQIPSLPEPADPLRRYLLVYRGALGEEPDAVAAAWISGVTAVFLQRIFSHGTECQREYADDGVNFLGAVTSPISELDLQTLKVDGGPFDYPYCGDTPNDQIEAAEDEWQLLIHRSLPGGPGSTLTAEAQAVSYVSENGCGLIGNSFAANWRPGYPVGVTVELAELEPPTDPAALGAYAIGSNPPTVRRVIGTVTSGETRTFDFTGIRFFRLRIGSTPPAPIFGPLFDLGTGVGYCGLHTLITISE